MKQKLKSIYTLLIIAAALIMSAIGTYVITTGGSAQKLITKNPSEMMLTLGDLPEEYTLYFEASLVGWENEIGAEAIYDKTFQSADNTTYITSTASRFSTIEGAKTYYNYAYNKILNENIMPMFEIIGDESYARYAYTTNILIIDWHECYSVIFRKANVRATVVVESENQINFNDVIQLAKIVEGRI